MRLKWHQNQLLMMSWRGVVVRRKFTVRGWGASYGSQRECEVHRAYRAIDKAEGRLRALSKYARKPTRERLRDKLVTKQMFVEEELDRLARMIW